MHRVRRVSFVAEQAGESEALLQERLLETFRTSTTLIEAFLFTVQYEGALDLHVALCLRMERGIPDFDLLKAAQEAFARLFNNTQSMDTLFLNPFEYEKIVTVARPFYRRSSQGIV